VLRKVSNEKKEDLIPYVTKQREELDLTSDEPADKENKGPTEQDDPTGAVEVLTLGGDDDPLDEEPPFIDDGPLDEDEEELLKEKKEKKEEKIEWRRGGLIGVGAFGKVYEAMDVKTGTLIAVKQVTLEDASSKDEKEATAAELQNEIDLMRKLRHRNIVQLLGTERSGHTLSILMEYVPGKSLDSILSRYGSLQEDVICNYTKQILLALEYCHSKRVVHRDIKGKNILVDQTGCLKLADFGSAKAFHNELLPAASSAQKQDGKAPSSTYNYTPLWTAPEVLHGDYDTKVDVWSLGCVIIEMATAKPPWSEQNFENPFRALYHIGNSGAIPKLPDTLSETGLEFLHLCLQRDPEKRSSASELLKHRWLETVKL